MMNVLFTFLIASQVSILVSQEICESHTQWTNGSTKYWILKGRGGNHVYVRCMHGLRIPTNEVLIPCVDGEPLGNLPFCSNMTEIGCGKLSAPAHGRKICDVGAPRVGSRCIIKCEATHYLKGSGERTCSEHLVWTGAIATCHVRAECAVPPPLKHGTVIDCSQQKKPVFGDVCSFSCNEGFVLMGPTRLTCNRRGKLVDLDGKQNNPKCVQTTNLLELDVGEATTRLPFHQRVHPSSDPCHHSRGLCSHKCEVRRGVAECSCPSGYRLRRDNRTCVDINECREGTHRCQHNCHNADGLYSCSCRLGYSLVDGFYCKAEPWFTERTRNESGVRQRDSRWCRNQNGGCQQLCDDRSGRVQCDCNEGFDLAVDGMNCKEINTVGLDVGEATTRLPFHQRVHPSSDPCHHSRGLCSHKCEVRRGVAECSCPSGYRLRRDNRTCVDVDECSSSRLNSCDHRCHNLVGSYNCSCHPGFVLKNKFNCEACRINSYRFEADAACTDCPPNSFTDSEGKSSKADCSCSPGFSGSPTDDESCADIDECASDNFGCSEKCVNTPGSAHCSCSPGLELKADSKTCIDIDECGLKNGGCEGFCHNSFGNFSCSCADGYVTSRTNRYSCDDVDECADNNGGCSALCVNFHGGYHCACPEGHRLAPDGRSCIAVLCPQLIVPPHSSLRCFPRDRRANKSIFKQGDGTFQESPLHTVCRIKCDKGYEPSPFPRTAVDCQDNGKWNATLAECTVLQCPPLIPPAFGDVHPPECKEGETVKKFCYFTCEQGYRLDRRAVFRCKNDLTWNHDDFPSCVPEMSSPIIICPDDLTVELPLNENSANVTLEPPHMNFGDFRVSPAWVSVGGPILFPAGTTDVTFIASQTTDLDETSNCTVRIMVVDKEPPRFRDCPESFSVNASGGLGGTSVQWDEPTVLDNVGVLTLLRNLEPNVTLATGIHSVEYVARDFNGNIGRCSFEISIMESKCSDLKDPANGEANCMDWMFGKICEPTCQLNYTTAENATQFYVCGDSGIWTPSDVVAPCIPECAEDEIWLPELEVCEPLSPTHNQKGKGQFPE